MALIMGGSTSVPHHKKSLPRETLSSLEVNGIDSLSTNIFDPQWSIIDAYRQLYRQYSLMVDTAA